MHTRTTVIAVLAVATLTLTACGSDDSGGGGLSIEDSPMNQYLGAAFGADLSEEEQQRKFEERQRKIEDLTAVCMAKEGFDYIPVDYSQNGGGVFFGGDEYQPDSRDWVAQYGYGIIKTPWDEQSQGAETVEFNNPNSEYLDSLSDSEREAYYLALYGSAFEAVEGEDPADIMSPADVGCSNKAAEEVYGTQDLDEEQFSQLFEEIGKLYEKVQNDPKLAELNGAWASCMADAGESGFSKQEDAQLSIFDAMDKLYENFDFAEDLQNFQNPRESPDFQKLAEREVELALKDLDCREKTKYRSQTLKIQFDMEEQFIIDHKAELDAYKAAAEQILQD